MKALTDKSNFAYCSDLDFFGTPVTSIGVKSHRFREVAPETTIQDNAQVVQFRLFNEQMFCSLQRSYIKVKFSIIDSATGQGFDFTDAAGKATDRAAVVQYFPKTMWSQIVLSINGMTVCDTGPIHSYRSFLLNELHNDKDVKMYNMGVTEMYSEEDTGESVESNKGYIAKARILKHGKTFECMSQLDIPLANTGKLLLNNCDVRITLHRASDKFLINSFGPNKEWKLKIESVKLMVCEYELFPDAIAGLEKNLASGESAFFPMRMHVCKSHFIPVGTINTPEIVAFSHGMQIPKRLYVGLCDNRNFSGDYARDPFEFNHHNLRNIFIDCGGKTWPMRPWNLDFANNVYGLSIVNTRECLGFSTSGKTNGIDYNMFKTSRCIYVFDLSTGSAYNTDAFDLSTGGNVNIRLEFTRAVGQQGLQMIIMGEFQSYMTLDRERNATVLQP